MATIKAYGSKHSHEFTLTVNEIQSSIDVTGNTSRVEFQFSIYKSSYSWSGYNNITYSININGSIYTGTIPRYTAGSALTIRTEQQVIGHESDGSKNINFSFSVTDNSGVSYTCGNASASGSMALTTIPRASTINSASGSNIEGNFVVTYTSYYSGFTNKLRISIPNVEQLEKNNYTSGTAFTLSSTTINHLYEYMYDKQSIPLGFVIETWNGNTKIGESAELVNYCQITDCSPTIGGQSYIDTNLSTVVVTGNNQKIVRNKSFLQINLSNIQVYKGAGISSCRVTIGNITREFPNLIDTPTQNATLNFGTLDVSGGTVPAQIVLTDSRGYTVSKTLQIIVLDYVLLSINAIVKRTQPTTGQVDTTFTGNYYNGSIGDTTNTLTMKWYYREYGDSEWTNGGTITPTIANNNKFNNGQSAILLGSSFDYKKSYEIKLEVEDALMTLEPIYMITEGIPIFDWGKDFFNVNGNILINQIPILSYSANEIQEGYWINDKPLYRKVVDTGSISGTTKIVNHGISNIGNVVNLHGIAYNSSLGVSVPLPRVYTPTIADQVGLQCGNTKITIEAGANASFSSSFVIVEYTKTTD